MPNPKPQPATVSDEKVEWAKKVIDAAIFPAIKTQLGLLNDTLAKRGIMAGIEINWYFETIEKDEDDGSTGDNNGNENKNGAKDEAQKQDDSEEGSTNGAKDGEEDSH